MYVGFISVNKLLIIANREGIVANGKIIVESREEIIVNSQSLCEKED
ncbi:hypothetical protein [Priestia taiwanensis]|uniref:Uncharacterized protein n=1 Tax=Priestia taiwanensis TaxID=1347902 RepID=A0A917ASV1_9BACI|nr:hypothetical protein [Priestia taiwanensis]MBM7364163.1 hypothetical protein [Priestia taiwanensis]GGE72126.1 hypothetical protein GCM10007140_22590 [Priestia taiwanensis]